MAEDLRIVKTKRAIRDAFMEIRVKQPLNKVRVRDICEKALINKSTFYHHYTDVYDLSDKLENEVLAACFESFEYRDRLLTDPLLFLENVPAAMNKQEAQIDVLFSGRIDVLHVKIMHYLRAFYQKPNMSEKEDITLTFIIGGSMYAMHACTVEGSTDSRSVTEASADIIRTIVQESPSSSRA